MLTYTRYNDTKLAIKGDKDKYHSEINKIGGRWNSRMKGGEGWTVPIEKETELKKLIRKVKKEHKNSLLKEYNNIESTDTDPDVKLANFLKTNENLYEDKIIDEEKQLTEIINKDSVTIDPELSYKTFESVNIETQDVSTENLEINEQENQDQSNIQDLAADNINSEDTNVELEETNVEVEDANVEVEDANVEVEETNVEVEDPNVEVEDPNVEVEDPNVEVEDVNVELEDANVEVEDANVEVEETNVEVEDANVEVEDANVEVEETNSLNSEVDHNESEYDSDSITRRSYSEDNTYTDDNVSLNKNEVNGDYDIYTKDQFKIDANNNLKYDSSDDSVINDLKDAKTALDDVIIDSDDDSAVVNNFLSNLLGDLSDEEEWNKKFKKSKERFRRITKSRELHRKKKEERAEKIKFKSQVLNQQKNGLENTESESTFDFYRGLALRNNEQYLSSDSDSDCTDSSDDYPSPSTVKEKSREEQIIDLETELLQLKLENERLSTQLKTVLQKY
jgi:hypothetical protein